MNLNWLAKLVSKRVNDLEVELNKNEYWYKFAIERSEKLTKENAELIGKIAILNMEKSKSEKKDNKVQNKGDLVWRKDVWELINDFISARKSIDLNDIALGNSIDTLPAVESHEAKLSDKDNDVKNKGDLIWREDALKALNSLAHYFSVEDLRKEINEINSIPAAESHEVFNNGSSDTEMDIIAKYGKSIWNVISDQQKTIESLRRDKNIEIDNLRQLLKEYDDTLKNSVEHSKELELELLNLKEYCERINYKMNKFFFKQDFDGLTWEEKIIKKEQETSELKNIIRERDERLRELLKDYYDKRGMAGKKIAELEAELKITIDEKSKMEKCSDCSDKYMCDINYYRYNILRHRVIELESELSNYKECCADMEKELDIDDKLLEELAKYYTENDVPMPCANLWLQKATREFYKDDRKWGM